MIARSYQEMDDLDTAYELYQELAGDLKDNPEFLEQIQPKLALISAGQNNRYRHPHQETLQRFEKFNTTIYRTDQQGAIRLIGWNSWRIETVH